MSLNLSSLNPSAQKRVIEQMAREDAARKPAPSEDAVPEHDVLTKLESEDESVLQNDCENSLNYRTIAFMHMSIRAREKKGWPDLTFALQGRPIAVELKSSTGKLSQDQIDMLTRMKQDGWEVYVIRSHEVFLDLLSSSKTIKQWSPE